MKEVIVFTVNLGEEQALRLLKIGKDRMPIGSDEKLNALLNDGWVIESFTCVTVRARPERVFTSNEAREARQRLCQGQDDLIGVFLLSRGLAQAQLPGSHSLSLEKAA